MESLHGLEEKAAAQQRACIPASDTMVLLIRHGHTDAVGARLVGRLPGVGLSDIGRQQAGDLVHRLRSEPIAAIYASPLERATETAEPLARARGLPVRTCDGLHEVEFGDWTGLSFEALDRRTDWRRFNAARGGASVPGGESAVDVQRRIVQTLEALQSRHPSQTIVAISHADVIRAAVLHATATALDEYHRYEIRPASVSGLRIGPAGSRLVYVNRLETRRGDQEGDPDRRSGGEIRT